MARGFRNNNPGNLIITANQWQGKIPVSQNTDGRFEQFTDMFWGIRAMLIDIIGDIATDGKNTLRKLIYEYAPPHENNTEAYIRYVTGKTGIGPNDRIPLNRKTLQAIAEAKIQIENGQGPYQQFYRAADFARAWQELPARTLALMGADTARRRYPVFLVVLAVVLVWLLVWKYAKPIKNENTTNRRGRKKIDR